MDFLFLRHAESQGNLQGIMQGRRDYALSEMGQRQAQVVAEYLQSCHFESRVPDQIYCSPLQRACQTAQPLQMLLPEIPFATHAELVEVDSGIFSGLTWQEAGAQYPEVQRAFQAARDWGAVPEGESKLQLWQRAERFLTELRERHTADSLILLVTHGGFIRAALSVLAGIGPEEKLFLCIDNTSLSLAGERNGRRYVRYMNDTRHLKSCDLIPDFIPH